MQHARGKSWLLRQSGSTNRERGGNGVLESAVYVLSTVFPYGGKFGSPTPKIDVKLIDWYWLSMNNRWRRFFVIIGWYRLVHICRPLTSDIDFHWSSRPHTYLNEKKNGIINWVSKWKLTTVKKFKTWKANVLMVSSLLERIKELWFVCDYSRHFAAVKQSWLRSSTKTHRNEVVFN